MEPLDTGFSAPILDFFRPTSRRHDIYSIRLEDSGSWSFCYRGGQYSDPLPSGTVAEIYMNDLHGLSLHFSDAVEYCGNNGGCVALKIRGGHLSCGFFYPAVARVKKEE